MGAFIDRDINRNDQVSIIGNLMYRLSELSIRPSLMLLIINRTSPLNNRHTRNAGETTRAINLITTKFVPVLKPTQPPPISAIEIGKLFRIWFKAVILNCF